MLVVVTNRKLVNGNFLEFIQEISKGNPFKLILREKDLDKSSYCQLFQKLSSDYIEEGMDLVIHNHSDIGVSLGVKTIHFSFNEFKKLIGEDKKGVLANFKSIGVSIHSKEESKFAEENGANYLIAGHIFQTDSKKDLKPKGLSYLKEIVNNTSLDVYGIGGINLKNIDSVLKTGVKGVAIMSDIMKSKNPYKKVLDYKKVISDFNNSS
ncbi:MAG: thiamine phosphate synthase [Methanobrevibacter sp.]|jgi:thiamine-phosphate pyrophosphorylase|nr:thiamine phosphate synthase [Methanobrevibacter sp.]